MYSVFVDQEIKEDSSAGLIYINCMDNRYFVLGAKDKVRLVLFNPI